MPRKSQHIPACPNSHCEHPGSVHRHGFLRTRHGRRRRFLCKACGHTFVTSRGTPYFRIRSSRAAFDRVVALSVEGISISAIARLQGLSWSTVARWLEKAAAAADQFSNRRLRDFELLDLQLDEMRTFALGKDKPTWIYAALEVSSRLWTTAHTGRRAWQPTIAVMRDVARRALPGAVPRIATDGYLYYHPAIRKTF